MVSTHLILDTNDYGVIFEWREADGIRKEGQMLWSPFDEATKYYEPSSKNLMINSQIADL